MRVQKNAYSDPIDNKGTMLTAIDRKLIKQ